MRIACADSRVDPQMIVSAAPDAACHGTSAAVEFGVRVLGVARILVMGHASCGGMRTLLEGTPRALAPRPPGCETRRHLPDSPPGEHARDPHPRRPAT